MILADSHMHSRYSFDGREAPEAIIRAAIQKGLSAICLTDHQDWEPEPHYYFFSAEDYFRELTPLIEKYSGEIAVTAGVEMGMAPERTAKCRAHTQQYPFGFVIGSVHTVNGVDPYFGEYYEGRSLEASYRAYFQTMAACLREKPDIDVLGHLDYVVRYGDKKNGRGFYGRFADEIDTILRLLVEQGIGIEMNTVGLRYGLEETHPSREVIARYHELGGEIVTVGSDAHKTEDIAYAFDRVPDFLESAGVSYYAVFRNRKPEFHHI